MNANKSDVIAPTHEASVNRGLNWERIANSCRDLWNQHGAQVQYGVIAILATAAVLKFTEESIRLLYNNGPNGATDLRWFRRAVAGWFAGEDVFSSLGAEYPPATFALLFPLLGWMSESQARWLWEFLNVIALGWLSILLVKQSKTENFRERVIVGLIPFAMIGTGVAIGNGQPAPFLVPLILSGILLLQKSNRTIANDLVACICMLTSLIKPNVTAPFFWIVLLAPRRVWQTLVVGIAYLALTFFAASFQHSDVLALLSTTFQNAVVTAGKGGYANLHWILTSFGMQDGFALVSLITFGALGLWVFWNREQDVWILLGVSGIIARIWTYHMQYDNLLIIFPLVTLVRIIKGDTSPRTRLIAVVLTVITMAGMLMPARWQFSKSPMFWFSMSAHSLAWAADLIFLLIYAAKDKQRMNLSVA